MEFHTPDPFYALVIPMAMIILLPAIILAFGVAIIREIDNSKAKKFTSGALIFVLVSAVIAGFASIPFMQHQNKEVIKGIVQQIEADTGVAVPVEDLYDITYVSLEGGEAEFHGPPSEDTAVGDVVTEYKVEYKDDTIYLFEKTNDGLTRLL